MNILITGGAGFIGHHAALRFLGQGHNVAVYDNLSRPGSADTASRLADVGVRLFIADIRDRDSLEKAIAEVRPDAVLHLAGQVAVTASIADPRADFEVNAGGTLNVLETLRAHAPGAVMIFASTNKVYGEMAKGLILPHGIREDWHLDFLTPYGCSKGVADQYCLDYARTYGLRTVVLRQSCIYGTEQYGIEDQGWVAWFCNRAVMGKTVTLFGDGAQVRDLLWIDDLLDLYDAILKRPEEAEGEVFNIGGGPATAMSLCGVLARLEEITGGEISVKFAAARTGDQQIYVSNIDKALVRLGFSPKVMPVEGIERLHDWMAAHREEIAAWSSVAA